MAAFGDRWITTRLCAVDKDTTTIRTDWSYGGSGFGTAGSVAYAADVYGNVGDWQVWPPPIFPHRGIIANLMESSVHEQDTVLPC
jgi:hypothetical protein